MAHDSFNTRDTLTAGGTEYAYYSLPAAQAQLGDLSHLPRSLKVLLENQLRHEDGQSVTPEAIRAIAQWPQTAGSQAIAFRPTRVLMQDLTGVPAVVDLAAMRDAMQELGGDPNAINPLVPVDLAIDHSVNVDSFGSSDALERNVASEFERNRERYTFLRWGAQAFDNFRVVPPGTGICHQVNLEYLGQVVRAEPDPLTGCPLAVPDTLVGTDSHTPMIDALAVLGWGVGGIEAEAAMLGQPISMLLPPVVGVRLTGRLREGATATDLVLTVTQLLRQHGVVGKFVEFCGDGLDGLTLPDRATLANMSPEFGCTVSYFPIDAEVLRYLRFTGRGDCAELVHAYAQAQGLWRDASTPEPQFSEVLELDLGEVEPAIAGPRRPQDRISLSQADTAFEGELERSFNIPAAQRKMAAPLAGTERGLTHGDVVVAAITSCTNTSNPSVMVAAGLLARRARERGLSVQPWVKTSLAPGSQVVAGYLQAAGLQADLDALGFNIVGYGCTTCIGNSGPLPEAVSQAIERYELVTCSVLSGNRNFEGRIQPQVRANYLASPPLVVAYALAGSMRCNLLEQPLGTGSTGQPVYLADLWPSPHEVQATIEQALTPELFRRRYADVSTGTEAWRQIEAQGSTTYSWDASSTYIKRPPFFDGISRQLPPTEDIRGARPLALLGDSVTTDHISPAAAIAPDSPAGRYLQSCGVAPRDFNSYGARRGNHEVMLRGTFANVRLRNEMTPEMEGGVTRHQPSGELLFIYDAAMRYCAQDVPTVVVAGREYGVGSSRDWAAKGPRLLGVKAVIAESFERIHRANLVGMGVLPLQFQAGTTRQTLGLTGEETFDVTDLARGELAPGQTLTVTVYFGDGRSQAVPVTCRIDTAEEVTYYRHGGILDYVVQSLSQQAEHQLPSLQKRSAS